MTTLVEIFNHIIEGSYNAQGVGDKAYEKFHISTDEPNLKVQAELQKQENGRPVAIIGFKHTYVFLNPKSLKYFGKNTRAVADNQGNIYVAQKDGDFIHYEIAKAVGIAPSDPYYQGDDFIRLIRIGNSNNFHDVSEYWDTHIHAKAIKMIRMKHPNFNIISNY